MRLLVFLFSFVLLFSALAKASAPGQCQNAFLSAQEPTNLYQKELHSLESLSQALYKIDQIQGLDHRDWLKALVKELKKGRRLNWLDRLNLAYMNLIFSPRTIRDAGSADIWSREFLEVFWGERLPSADIIQFLNKESKRDQLHLRLMSESLLQYGLKAAEKREGKSSLFLSRLRVAYNFFENSLYSRLSAAPGAGFEFRDQIIPRYLLHQVLEEGLSSETLAKIKMYNPHLNTKEWLSFMSRWISRALVVAIVASAVADLEDQESEKLSQQGRGTVGSQDIQADAVWKRRVFVGAVVAGVVYFEVRARGIGARQLIAGPLGKALNLKAGLFSPWIIGHFILKEDASSSGAPARR